MLIVKTQLNKHHNTLLNPWKEPTKKVIFYPCFVSCPFFRFLYKPPRKQKFSVSISIHSEYTRHTSSYSDLYIYTQNVSCTAYIQHKYIYLYLFHSGTKHSWLCTFRLRIWGNEGVYVLCLIRSLWDFTLTFVSMTLKILSQSTLT